MEPQGFVYDNNKNTTRHNVRVPEKRKREWAWKSIQRHYILKVSKFDKNRNLKHIQEAEQITGRINSPQIHTRHFTIKQLKAKNKISSFQKSSQRDMRHYLLRNTDLNGHRFLIWSHRGQKIEAHHFSSVKRKHCQQHTFYQVKLSLKK